MKRFVFRETLGINFDPSHLVWQGIDEKQFLRDFRKRIYHVHIKDVKVNLNGKKTEYWAPACRLETCAGDGTLSRWDMGMLTLTVLSGS